MTILSLDIAHFGMFQNRTVTLRPGVNIITGDNESGKSTLADFIICMLFGMEGEEEYRKYLPYQFNGVYGGSIRILFEEGFYEIQRSFLKDETSLKVISLQDNTQLSEPELFLAEVLNGIRKEEFKKTGLVTRETQEAELKEFDDSFKSQEELRLKKQQLQFRNAYQSLEKKKQVFEKELEVEYESPESLRALREKKEETFYKKNAEIFDYEHELRDKKALFEKKKARDAIAAKQEKEHAAVFEKLREARTAYENLGKGRVVLGSVFIGVGIFCFIGGIVFGFMKSFDISNLWTLIILAASAVLALGFLIAGMVILIVITSKFRRAKQRIRVLEREYADYGGAPVEEEYFLDVTKDIVDSLTRLIAGKKEDVSRLLGEQKELEIRIQEADRLEKRNKELTEEVAAIRLAMDSFESLTDIKAGEKLAQIVSQANQYFSALETEGAQKLELTSDDQVYVCIGGENTPLHALSGHTAFEALFALKNAKLDAIDSEGAVPLVLDDALNDLDRDRMLSAMDLIHTLKRQVILFSCHTRERQAQYGTEE